MSTALTKLEAETKRVLAEHRVMREACLAMYSALQDVAEYLEGREDVIDGPDGEPRPNAEMTLAVTVRAAIEKAEGKA